MHYICVCAIAIAISATYERARQKLKAAEDTSDINTTDCEEPKRKRFQSILCILVPT